MTEQETLQLVEMLFDAGLAGTPANARPETMIRVYHLVLGNVPLDVVMQSLQRHLSTSPYFPRPADLMNAAKAITDDTPDDGAAYAELVREIRRVGYNGKPTFSSPAIGEAVSGLGGWRSICMMEADELQKTFGFQYRAIKRRYEDRGNFTAIGSSPSPELDGGPE